MCVQYKLQREIKLPRVQAKPVTVEVLPRSYNNVCANGKFTLLLCVLLEYISYQPAKVGFPLTIAPCDIYGYNYSSYLFTDYTTTQPIKVSNLGKIIMFVILLNVYIQHALPLSFSACMSNK